MRTAELERLGVFAGTWNIAGEMLPSALGPGGHFSGVHVGAWEYDGYFLVMRYTGIDNGRPVSQIDLYGWDAGLQRYTFDSFNSLGQRGSFTGTVEGDTWNWSADRTAGGARLDLRMVQHFADDASMTWKIETSTDATRFTTVVTGQATRP